MDSPQRSWRWLYRLEHWDAITGVANSVEIWDTCCVAIIDGMAFILPLEFAARLRGVRGQHIVIIRTDKDFRMRIIHPSNIVGRLGPLVIVQDSLRR